MKWILIGLAIWLLVRLCRWLSWAIPKIRRLEKLEKFEKTKDVNVFKGLRNKQIIKVEKIVEELKDTQSLHREILQARSVIRWYSEEEYRCCSIKELDSVIFYSILKELAERKLKCFDNN